MGNLSQKYLSQENTAPIYICNIIVTSILHENKDYIIYNTKFKLKFNHPKFDDLSRRLTIGSSICMEYYVIYNSYGEINYFVNNVRDPLVYTFTRKISNFVECKEKNISNNCLEIIFVDPPSKQYDAHRLFIEKERVLSLRQDGTTYCLKATLFAELNKYRVTDISIVK